MNANPGPRRIRRLGAVIGLGVSLLFATIAAPVFGSVEMDVGTYIPLLALPALITGGVCGWLLGPRAARASSAFDRAAVGLGLAFLATAIGCFLVGFAIGAGSPDPGSGLGGRLVQGLVAGAALWPIGLLLFGLVALPVTFGAGLVWAWLMSQLSEGRRPTELEG